MENAVSPDDFRRLALAFDGASEATHMGHPDFRANGRIFATLSYPDAGLAMVALTPDEQAMRVAASPQTFSPVPGGWGRNGSTHVILATADEAAVRDGLTVAWRIQMDKPPARARKRPGSGGSP